MEEGKKPLKSAIGIKLASMNDLVRMAFFSAPRNNGLSFLLFKNNEKGKWNIGFLTGVTGYYELWGVPMFFYVILDKKPNDHKFIRYTSKEKEKWDFIDSTSDPAKWNYLPVVHLAEQPSFFNP